MTDSLWNIVRVAPGKEREASQAPHGCFCFVPQRQVRRFNRRHRVWRKYTEVMVPGYLFVPEAHTATLLSFPSSHIFGVLKNAERQYVTITQDEIDEVKAHEEQFLLSVPQHPFAPGDRVQMTHGALKGHLAVVKKLEGLERLSINIALFGSKRKASVHASDVIAA